MTYPVDAKGRACSKDGGVRIYLIHHGSPSLGYLLTPIGLTQTLTVGEVPAQMIEPIEDSDQYDRALRRRALIVVPLIYADKLPPGVLPPRERRALQALYDGISAEIHEYEATQMQLRQHA